MRQHNDEARMIAETIFIAPHQLLRLVEERRVEFIPNLSTLTNFGERAAIDGSIRHLKVQELVAQLFVYALERRPLRRELASAFISNARQD